MWTQTEFPFQPGTAGLSPGQQSGSQAAVPCDGSGSINVVFPTPFLSIIPQVYGQVTAVSNANQIVGTPQITNITLTGFTVYIAGAITGTICTLEYYTQGGF